MNSIRTSRVLAVLFAGFFFATAANAATQTIYATSSRNNTTTGNATTASPAKVTCTSASGGGTSSRCFIQAPGWSGLVPAGQSIGTSGAGNIVLSCTGTYPVGGSISCSAKVDDTACASEQSISATSNSSGVTQGMAAIKSPSIVECSYAAGGGTSSKCFVQAPGYSGLMLAGQSIPTTGAGTVVLGCSGTYPVGGSLSCTADISQVCP